MPSDGRFHLANVTNDVRGKGDGRIKIFPDRQGGICWNHKSGEQQLFFINQKNVVAVSDEERQRIKQAQQRRENERKIRQNQAAKRAQIIWSNAKPTPSNHPYLLKKHVKPYLTRVSKWERTIQNDDGKRQKNIFENVLLVPLFNASGRLRNLQAIFPEKPPELGRGKDFMPSAELSNLFWWLGEKSNPVCVCEGFATASTLCEQTGYRVYMAFTANNLMSVGQIIRKHLPDTEIVFCADNDEQTKGNPGLTKATEAAAFIGGTVAVPPIAGDFNDYANHSKEAR